MSFLQRVVLGNLLAFIIGGCCNFIDEIATLPIERTVNWFVDKQRENACIVGAFESDGSRRIASRNCDVHSIFRVGSLSKLLLEHVVLELHKEGKIDIDLPVTDYYKGKLVWEYQMVSLRDLLENKSGLPREFLFAWNPVDLVEFVNCGLFGTDIYRTFDARDEFEAQLNSYYVRSCVRNRKRQYSNMGFALLMMAITDYLDVTLEQLVDTQLISKYSLSDTTYNPQGDQVSRLTKACAGSVPWFAIKGSEICDHNLGEVTKCAGGLRTSLADISKLSRLFWTQIDQIQVAQMVDEADIGVFKVKVLSGGRRLLYRQGMIYGGASFIGFDLVDRRMVVILRNVTSWPSEEGFLLMERLMSN